MRFKCDVQLYVIRVKMAGHMVAPRHAQLNTMLPPRARDARVRYARRAHGVAIWWRCECVSQWFTESHGVAWGREVGFERSFKLLTASRNYAVITCACPSTIFRFASPETQASSSGTSNAARGISPTSVYPNPPVCPAAKWQRVTPTPTTASIRSRFSLTS